ncbi:hypothetical protein V5799_031587 [Amblyomma americanum]|uniref:Uncharacterized protein n=1 Tax=Amblyomma americanum TaxID=6943 RepID=A0AAQ4DTL2_AMBAM
MGSLTCSPAEIGGRPHHHREVELVQAPSHRRTCDSVQPVRPHRGFLYGDRAADPSPWRGRAGRVRAKLRQLQRPRGGLVHGVPLHASRSVRDVEALRVLPRGRRALRHHEQVLARLPQRVPLRHG